MINQWTDDELQILKDHYKSKGSKFVAEQINKSQKAVTAKAARLGLSLPLLWSDDEGQSLLQLSLVKIPIL